MRILNCVQPHRVLVSIRLAAFLLSLISGVALYLTDRLHISSLILIFSLPLAWFLGKRKPAGSWWEFASFLYLLFFFFDLFRFSHSLAPALVHLFIFIMINKLFNLFAERDYHQLYLLTFLSILAASSLSVEFEMMYVIAAYIFVLVWNVLSLTLWKEWKKAGGNASFPFSIFHPSYLLAAGGTTFAVFAVALAIFFILPRMQLGYLSGLYPGKVQHVSGFAQKVELGEIAQIQEVPDETMRVRVSSKISLIGHRFYWRGIAFDRYDGRSWSTGFPGTRFLFQDSSNTFYNAHYSEAQNFLVKQEFYLVPLDTRVIFGQDKIVKVVGNFSAVTRDANHGLMGMGRPQNYEVYSRIQNISPSRLRGSKIEMTDPFRKFYTQLPNRSPEIESLAREITANARNVYDQVVAIRKYLEENYLYTTSGLPLDTKDPVSVFLFQKRAGHCEYFATAMAMLLRHLGIPCRVVNGFLEGDYNDIGKFYLVRQSDAHTWVEVYFGDHTWIPFDPSPRQIGTGAGIGSWLRWFDVRKIVDSLEFFWDRYILIFSAQDQIDALSALRDRYHEISDGFRERSKATEGIAGTMQDWWARNRLPGVLGVFVIVAIVFGLFLLRRYQKAQEMVKTPVLFYREMLTILQKKGYSRAASTTPSEFIETLKSDMPQKCVEDLTSLTDLFYKARFGHYDLTGEEQSFVKNALRRLNLEL